MSFEVGGTSNQNLNIDVYFAAEVAVAMEIRERTIVLRFVSSGHLQLILQLLILEEDGWFCSAASATTRQCSTFDKLSTGARKCTKIKLIPRHRPRDAARCSPWAT